MARIGVRQYAARRSGNTDMPTLVVPICPLDTFELRSDGDVSTKSQNAGRPCLICRWRAFGWRFGNIRVILSPWIDFETFRDRIGHMFFRDDADDVIAAGDAMAANDDGHEGFFPPYPFNDVGCDHVLSHDRIIAAGDVAQCNAGIGAFEAAPKSSIDADDAKDLAASDHHDMAQPPLRFVLAQKAVETVISPGAP